MRTQGRGALEGCGDRALLPPRSSQQVKRLMTATEKILAKKSGNVAVRPGDNIWTNIDLLMTHDVCGPGTFGIFQKEFGMDAKVRPRGACPTGGIPPWAPRDPPSFPCLGLGQREGGDHPRPLHLHLGPPRQPQCRHHARHGPEGKAPTWAARRDWRSEKETVVLLPTCAPLQYDIKYFYDITDRSNFKANPDYKGVCHVALAQEGHCRPGEVLVGTDSHTCNAGAFGEFATGIGNTDAGFVLGTGKLLLKVPPTMRFVLEGEIPPYILAKDLILYIIGEITVSGATYKAMEFTGPALAGLNMEERMTICNMVVEAGGKNGIIPPDQITFDYVNARTNKPYEAVYSDDGASYVVEYRIDVSKLVPVVAAPHSPDNRKTAFECRDKKIDRVYIGSCTGGKSEDFFAAAKILHRAGKKVVVPTYLVPATQKVWADVYTVPVPGCDGKTAAQIFEEAGCVTPAAPSCAACLGAPLVRSASPPPQRGSDRTPLLQVGPGTRLPG